MISIPEFTSAQKPIRFFEEITKIPRGSGNTASIAEYLVSFARARGLTVIRDTNDNVIIKKTATKGYESRPGIIFQGHTDIVAEKAQNVNIDMQNEGPRIYRDGDFLRAEGTTLGADDGVAIAYALAVLDSDDIEHPSFEAVFTSDEETGLIGATTLDGGNIDGRLLINIDSDVEGVFTVGCAGGVRVDTSLPVRREAVEGKRYKLSVTGLRGGHSGIEIDKGRVNAIKLLGELLSRLPYIRIISLEGGNADNAIPRDATAMIAAPKGLSDKDIAVLDWAMKRYASAEMEAKHELEETVSDKLPLDQVSSEKVISLIKCERSGVVGMSTEIEGLVETSLNMGIAKLEDNEFSLSFSLRSSKGSEKTALFERVRQTAEGHGAVVTSRGDYPAWEYRKDSHLRDVMCKVYEDMYGKAPKVLVIHAGLECGILSDKLEGLDCVSIGPDNFDIHTPEEHLSLPSFTRVWEYLLEVLKNI